MPQNVEIDQHWWWLAKGLSGMVNMIHGSITMYKIMPAKVRGEFRHEIERLKNLIESTNEI